MGSCNTPRAFQAEYPSLVERALTLISAATQSELERAVAPGDAWSENALHYAAGCGCLDACDVLARCAVRLNFSQDARGATPLLWAARHGMARAAEVLLRQGADANHTDSRGRTALHLAAQLGFPRTCLVLLTSEGMAEKVDRCDDRGWTALHAAACAGSVTVCGLLCQDYHAQPSVRTAIEGRTPLHLAAIEGHVEVIKYLLKRVPMEALSIDALGLRPVDLARQSGHAQAIELLQDRAEEHQSLVKEWSSYCGEAGYETQLPHPEGWLPSLDLAPPQVRSVRRLSLDLVCRIVDLDYRLIEYVVEVRGCGGGRVEAAPVRVYFVKTGEQRKIDSVKFSVPRTRENVTEMPRTGENRTEIWRHGLTYQFRVTGRCERTPALPEAPWQVTSEWSPMVRLQRTRSSSERRGKSRGSDAFCAS